MRPDARPQARKNRRCIRWNTLRIFSGRERCRWSRIVRRSRTVNVGQAPRLSPQGLSHSQHQRHQDDHPPTRMSLLHGHPLSTPSTIRTAVMDNFYNTGTNTRINPAAVKIPPTTMRSLSEIAVRDEAKEVWPEARPKTTQVVADHSPRNRIETRRGHEARGWRKEPCFRPEVFALASSPVPLA
jgi:hypothetical protein